MRDIPQIFVDDVKRGRYPSGEFFLFELITGEIFGIWRGAGEVDVDGITYKGTGDVVDVPGFSEGLDLSASSIDLKVRAVPALGLTPDVLATIDNSAYKNADLSIFVGFFDRDTGLVVRVELWWQGYLDVVTHDRTIGAEHVLSIRCEPASLDHSRRGFRMFGHADQQELVGPSEDDLFFEHAATTPSERGNYGRKDDVGTAGGAFGTGNAGGQLFSGG